MKSLLTRVFSFIIILGLSGCAYHARRSGNALLRNEGIRKIYVAPIQNETYQAGIHNTVYNSLVRTVSANRLVRLVRSKKSADAILEGAVKQAEYRTEASTPSTSLEPSTLGLGNKRILVASVYRAFLTCQFSLTKVKADLIFKKDKKNRKIPTGLKKRVWSSKFTRSKTFPSNNQLSTPGTTSALINDSEFERALSDLSNGMMDEVHESMLALF